MSHSAKYLINDFYLKSCETYEPLVRNTLLLPLTTPRMGRLAMGHPTLLRAFSFCNFLLLLPLNFSFSFCSSSLLLKLTTSISLFLHLLLFSSFSSSHSILSFHLLSIHFVLLPNSLTNLVPSSLNNNPSMSIHPP